MTLTLSQQEALDLLRLHKQWTRRGTWWWSVNARMPISDTIMGVFKRHGICEVTVISTDNDGEHTSVRVTKKGETLWGKIAA
jgi:hypothetical protein